MEDSLHADSFIESKQWQLTATVSGDTSGHFLTLPDQCHRRRLLVSGS